jgi:hypothetical protein
MADDQFRAPNNQLRPGRTPSHPSDRPGTSADAASAQSAAVSVGAEALMYVRWMAGLLLVLCLGWGTIFFVGYLAYAAKIPVPLDIAVAVASVLDLGLFLLLQRKLWLSRFMGLRLDSHSSPLKEAVLLWALGPLFLMFRSTAAAEPAADPNKPAEYTDSFREIVETIVFVVVLVLLLKTFVAEAFVIPTGSMASTLLGYHKMITCPQCGHTQPVNCSAEVEPQKGQPKVDVEKCECENCRFTIWLKPRGSAEREFR